jgi:hypothetical protein
VMTVALKNEDDSARLLGLAETGYFLDDRT